MPNNEILDLYGGATSQTPNLFASYAAPIIAKREEQKKQQADLATETRKNQTELAMAREKNKVSLSDNFRNTLSKIQSKVAGSNVGIMPSTVDKSELDAAVTLINAQSKQDTALSIADQKAALQKALDEQRNKTKIDTKNQMYFKNRQDALNKLKSLQDNLSILESEYNNANIKQKAKLGPDYEAAKLAYERQKKQLDFIDLKIRQTGDPDVIALLDSEKELIQDQKEIDEIVKTPTIANQQDNKKSGNILSAAFSGFSAPIKKLISKSATMTPDDKVAFDWASKNPNDKDAQQIMTILTNKYK